MARRKTALARPSRLLRAPIPLSRDPFINALMTRLLPDAAGAERFWISTWNSHSGSLGVMIDEHGGHRIHRFQHPRWPGFYSAIPAGAEDPDGLWLCGWLERISRFDLRTGEMKDFPTGAPGTLVFNGMPIDHATGKLLAVAFAPPRTVAVSFDYRTRKVVKVQDAPTQGHYSRFSFPNGDGTWSILLHLPGDHLLIWDPRTDALEEVAVKATGDGGEGGGSTYMLLRDEQGKVYFPHRGWYDPMKRTIGPDGPRPREEMTWFGRFGQTAVGVNNQGATATLGVWDLPSGNVRQVATIPDCYIQNVNLTASGKVVAVNVYGEFFRIDAASGELECSRRLATDAIGGVDCLCRLDKNRILGTPFITQRFWETNLKTRRAFDAGRAAPGFGQITQARKIGKKVYMTAYTGGELLEYDPAQLPRFPENPRVVADPPGGMRPVAFCTVGRDIFYTCSNEYGHLGSTLTRYDTRTGLSRTVADPFPEQMIQGLAYDRPTRRLLACSTFEADCGSAPTTHDTCYFLTIDPQKMEILERWPASKGTKWSRILGPLGGSRWLCTCHDDALPDPGTGTAILDLKQSSLHFNTGVAWLPPGARDSGVAPAGKPGLFVVKVDKQIELWDLRQPKRLGTLHRSRQPIHNFCVQDDSILLALPTTVAVLEGCLKGI